MKAKEALKVLKISRQTLCSYVKQNKIKVTKLPNKTYDYDEDDVFKCANISTTRKCVVYARVSTQKQKNDLANQITTIKNYANSNGYVVETVYSDIASGLNYDRGEFKTMLNEIMQYKIKTVFISNKDRLTRISFDLWKELFKQFSCDLVVINQDDSKNEDTEKELFEDIISMLHCFAMKMYSNRRKKKIQLVEEDLTNEISL